MGLLYTMPTTTTHFHIWKCVVAIKLLNYAHAHITDPPTYYVNKYLPTSGPVLKVDTVVINVLSQRIFPPVSMLFHFKNVGKYQVFIIYMQSLS